MGFADNILAARRRGETVKAEKRAEWGSSAIPGPLAGGGSFATVSLGTLENNFQQVAIWSSQDLLASVSAQLPIDTYKLLPDGGKKNIGNPKVIEDPGGEGHGVADWVYQYLISKLSRGNAVGRPFYDSNGYPTQIVLYHPDEVQGWRDRSTGRPQWRIDNRMVDPSEVWHRRSYAMPGAFLGLSPLTIHQTTIRLGVSSTRFGAQFFSDSAIPSAILKNDEENIDQTIATEIKARWMNAVYGTREPVVFGKGWDHKTVSLNPDESQFLETNKYSQAQCARIYGPNIAEILGYETGGTMTYANVEQRSIDFLKFTLNRWLRDLELTMSMWLPRGEFVKVNRAALLETDLLTRFKAYQIATGNRPFLAPSEARDYEDLRPFTEAQMQELESVPAAKPGTGTQGEEAPKQ